MLGSPQGYWGKLESDADGRVTAWHPLVDHCADVAACCEALLGCDTLRRRLARLAGLADFSPVQLARLGVLAGLHDLGKFNRGFQAKALGPGARTRTAGHVGPGLSLVGHDHPLRDRASELCFRALETKRMSG